MMYKNDINNNWSVIVEEQFECWLPEVFEEIEVLEFALILLGLKAT